MNRIKRLGITIVIAMGLFGCSLEESQYSPEQVVNNALKEVTTPGSYYSESEMIYSENGQETEYSISKEWHSSDGKIRIESESKTGENKSTAVNDGTIFVMHIADENQAFIYEDDLEMPSLTPPSLKEQADMLLKMVEDTHKLSIEGEEKIANRMTHHLVAKPNKKNTLFGDMELWIDKENWMILKLISTNGNNSLEMIYTKMELDVEIPSEKFVLDLPEDVEVLDMDAIDNTTEVTLAEATDNMEKPFLYFPESNQWEIGKVELSKLEGEFNRIEINIDYVKDDLPLFTLSAFESPEEVDDEDLTNPGEELVIIREQEGAFMDLANFRIIYWKENGISYSVMPIDPNLSIEEVIEMTKEMKLTK
ncbi:LolA family protein [Sporosarcina sp. G11-34]|uniref:LolA family protein n=1 Tax=Sporosarcina sp. G11-34 TaxID=2849605 RepID=UPI0022A94839|nr:outer membrane lipoprotein carrier protein LolA [Sporosarcina sp. G11-34]MCZ2259430.1 outer membrane lipoprotein carrier protein LolA [Sporosarcina sp. G11-34]